MLHWQTEMVIGHVLDHWVMPQLVRRFKQRRHDAVDRGEDGEADQNECDPGFLVVNTIG